MRLLLKSVAPLKPTQIFGLTLDGVRYVPQTSVRLTPDKSHCLIRHPIRIVFCLISISKSTITKVASVSVLHFWRAPNHDYSSNKIKHFIQPVMSCKRCVLLLITLSILSATIAEGNFTFKRSRYRDRTRSTTLESTTERTTEANLANGVLESEEDPEDSAEADVSQDVKLVCGAQTAENHPWIAVIEHTDPNKPKSKKKTLSKGVLISSQHVLTTVSSIHNSHPFWVVSGIRLGDAPTWATESVVRPVDKVVHRSIDEVFIHENKDIAVIKLDKEVKFSGKCH